MILLLSKIKNKKNSNSVCYFLNPLVLLMIFAIFGVSASYANEEVEFNTDILDLKDRSNIDLSEFTRAGYIMPGVYPFNININRQPLSGTYDIAYIESTDDKKDSVPCLSPEIVSQLGLRSEWENKIEWWNNGQCLLINSIPGMLVNGSLATDSVDISIPQIYLQYSSPDWDPPSRWEEGISGILFDYNVNAQAMNPRKESKTQQISGNGILGANLGAWRFRANWQANYQHSDTERTNRNWDWNQYYAYRAIPAIGAKLSLGEEYLRSGIFDSFRYTGVSLMTDDNMLPPNLRGYAPEVTGVAKTNAKVTVSQQGRIIYESQIAAGPFRIQDLSDAVSGKLDVRVEEQDGSIQEFQIDTATIPYLTRPGRVQFKLVGGKPSNIDHHGEGPAFGLGEFSWGISNGWSLYGGGLGAGDYNALSIGVGRDLMAFGALSFDVTESRAKLPNDNKTYTGGSYRLSYSKRFDQYNSQITFAGYRFSERDFMNMSQYINKRYRNSVDDNNKELYTITFNKQFTDLGLGAFLNYSHETYWNKPTNERYNLSLSQYFDLGSFKNLNANLSVYRNEFAGKTDDGAYFNISMPWGDGGTISYNSVFNGRRNSHTASYYNRLDENNSYRLGAGLSMDGKASANGYFLHYGDLATVTASGSYFDDNYTSAAMSIQGGATITAQGGALHRSNMPGASRLLVDTEGAADVPVKGFGPIVRTNYFGKAIISDVNDYHRNTAQIDLNSLPDDIEAIRSIQQVTLTEGAIGYRKFQVLSGQKIMASLRLADGSYPPFGASVKNEKGRELGIVNDNGSAYLSGVNSDEVLIVHWSGVEQCQVMTPSTIDSSSFTNLILPCTAIKKEITAPSETIIKPVNSSAVNVNKKAKIKPAKLRWLQ